MKKIGVLVFIALLCFNLVGCNDNVAPYNEDEAIRNKVEQFDKKRLALREELTKRATQTPEEIGQLEVSLFDYEPITYLYEFEQKYPNVKIVQFQVHIKGMSGWSGKLDPGKSLKQAVEMVTKKWIEDAKVDIESTKKSGLGSDQTSKEILQAIAEGNIRTYAFDVQGQIKDLEFVAQQEYNKKIRVVFPEGLVGAKWIGQYYEPIYATYPGNKPDRWK